tara:strand:+ start:954 stop:1754 length:801 start_codon:yes stop_codon:yes gene_type:complete
MNKSYTNFCNNCGKNGHLFHQCKIPITSIGVILVDISQPENKYLMIRRKDTLGYIDFIRGRYPHNNINYIMNIINEMTIEEKERIVNNEFDKLWIELWGKEMGLNNFTEQKNSKDKFEALQKGISINGEIYTIFDLINSSTNKWIEPEWGFPKGRRNFNEKDYDCGCREFQEETGLSLDNISIIKNILPIEEIFSGSNYKSYKHKYFIAILKSNKMNMGNFQKTEVSKVEWKTYHDAIECIRSYNLEKIDIIKRINSILTKYTLYN